MILLYLGNQEPKKEEYIQVLQSLDLSYRILTDQNTTSTIQSLFVQTDTPQSDLALDHPLMVMKDIDDEQFQIIMQKLSQAGLEMQRKAMWTKHNQHWTFAQLAEEIEEEHRYFADLNRLYAFFQKSNQKDSNLYTEESWAQYSRCMIDLYLQVNKQQPSAEELNQMIEKAMEAERKLQKR